MAFAGLSNGNASRIRTCYPVINEVTDAYSTGLRMNSGKGTSEDGHGI